MSKVENEKLEEQIRSQLEKFDEHTLRCFSVMALNTEGYFQYFNYDKYYNYDKNDTREITNQILEEFRYLADLEKRGLDNVKESQLLLYHAIQDCNNDELIRVKCNVAGFLTDKAKYVSFDEYLFYIDCLNNLCWDKEEQGLTVVKLMHFSQMCLNLIRTRNIECLQKENIVMEKIKQKALSKVNK